jgi:hypothetical protein
LTREGGLPEHGSPDSIALQKGGFDLVAAADRENIQEAAQQFSKLGVNVRAVRADLAKQAASKSFTTRS